MSVETETNQFYQNLLDLFSHEPMFNVVILNCVHTVSQKTADFCIKQGLPCPFDHAQVVSSYIPNLIIREFVQLTAHPDHQTHQAHPAHPVHSAHPAPLSLSPAQNNRETTD